MRTQSKVYMGPTYVDLRVLYLTLLRWICTVCTFGLVGGFDETVLIRSAGETTTVLQDLK